MPRAWALFSFCRPALAVCPVPGVVGAVGGADVCETHSSYTPGNPGLVAVFVYFVQLFSWKFQPYGKVAGTKKTKNTYVLHPHCPCALSVRTHTIRVSVRGFSF